MNLPEKHVYVFGPFRFDAEEHLLLRDNKLVPLAPKVLETLSVLVQNAGHLVEKDELIKQLWPDAFVEDGNLNKSISLLRKTLGQWDGDHECIETIPKRGYRFVATVQRQLDTGTQRQTTLAPEKTSSSQSISWLGRRMGVAALLILILTLLVRWQIIQHRGGKLPNADLPVIRSLAVLPLDNLSSDPAQDYFADSMTDELITDLGQITNLRVTSRTSSMQYKSSAHKSLPQISRELNVDAVVEGSVVRSGNQVRITAQLIYAPSDRHLWAHSYEGELRDVLKLQAEVASDISNQVRVNVSPEKQVTVKAAPTVNPGAYEAYLKGFYSEKSRISGIQNSIAYFQQAIREQPNYVQAYAGLADAYIQLGHMLYLPPREAFPRAKEAAVRALQLDDSSAEAHNALATVMFLYEWDFAGAEREFQRALQLNANAVYTRGGYGDYLQAMGRFDDSRAATQRLHDIDPLSPSSIVDFAVDSYWAGRYDEAIEPARRVLDSDPSSANAHLWLGLAYEHKHNFGPAISELRKATQLSGDKGWIGFVAYALATSGDKSAARKILHDMKSQSQHSYVSPWWFAMIYCGLGQKTQALFWLERAYEDHEHDLVFSNVWPMFDILRPDPRFKDLMRRIGLPQ